MKKESVQDQDLRIGGQAALIIILVTAVVVTIILSSIGRTVTDVRIATQTSEANQALNAAEAGIERALVQLDNNIAAVSDCPSFDAAIAAPNLCRLQFHSTTPPAGLVNSQSIFWYTMTDRYPPTTGPASYTLGSIGQGDTVTIWLTNNPYATDIATFFSSLYAGPLTVTFATAGATVGVEISVVYQQNVAPNNILIDRFYASAANGSTFSGNLSNPPYNSRAGFVRLRPITGNLSQVTVSGYTVATFPAQGRIITSNGHYLGSGEASQAISKSIQVIRWHDELPPYFDYVLYSGGNVTKP